MHSKKILKLASFVLIATISYSNSVFSLEQKSLKKEINLNGIVGYPAKICKDSVLVYVYNRVTYKEELTRIDLKTLTTKVLHTFPRSNVFECDTDTENYFFSDQVNSWDDTTIFAYAPDQPEKFLWKFTLDSSLVDDIVVANNQNFVLVLSRDLLALNKTTGQLVWKLPIERVSRQHYGILVFNDTVYLTDNSGNRQAYDINNGALKWKIRKEKEYDICSYPYHIDTVTSTLISTCYDVTNRHNSAVIGIDASSGKLKWKLPIYSEGLLDISSTFFNNFVYSISAIKNVN